MADGPHPLNLTSHTPPASDHGSQSWESPSLTFGARKVLSSICKEVMAVSISFLYMPLSVRKTKLQFGSPIHCSELYFPPGLLSSLLKANVYFLFAANMAKDERFCHYFPYITNHKAALSHSLIASVSRLIVSNYQRHI